MLLNQPRNPFDLPLAQKPGLLVLDRLTLAIRLALQLLDNRRRLSGVNLNLVVGQVVQRVVERVRGTELATRNFNPIFVVDHTQNLAGLWVTLDLGLAEFELLGRVAAAGDVQRVFGEFSLDGEALFATSWGVEFVQQTEALVVLGQSEFSVPVEN